MENEKKVKKWRNLFRDPTEDSEKDRRRLREVSVLLYELDNVKQSARVFEGSSRAVMFQADLGNIKASLTTEQGLLRKRNQQTEGETLAF